MINVYELRSIGIDSAQRAMNAGGELLPIASPFYSGGQVYSHILFTARGRAYRVNQNIAEALQCLKD